MSNTNDENLTYIIENPNKLNYFQNKKIYYKYLYKSYVLMGKGYEIEKIIYDG